MLVAHGQETSVRKNVPQYRLPSGTDFSNPTHLEQLNKLLQNLGDRLDTVQQIGATAPPAPLNLAAVGKQGLFAVTWNRIENVDGYVLCWSANSTMVPIAGRATLHDSDSCDFRLPVGNCVAAYFFTVSAFIGNQVSSPSNAVQASTIAYTTVGSAPADAPKTPRAALVVGPRGGANLP